MKTVRVIRRMPLEGEAATPDNEGDEATVRGGSYDDEDPSV